jgi:hypothetical protein
MYGGPQQKDFATTIHNLTGITQCKDLNGGNANCVAFVPNVRIRLIVCEQDEFLMKELDNKLARKRSSLVFRSGILDAS